MYRTLLATCGKLLSNENELLTHTLHSKVRYFHVTPPRPQCKGAASRIPMVIISKDWKV